MSAISGAGDPNAAHMAATLAHGRAQDAWRALAGDTLYTAGATGGQRLATSMQQAGASVPDYNPDDSDPDALTAWVGDQQNALGDAVHTHTGGMLADALTAALALGTLEALTAAANALYDQWTGQGASESDYSAAVAGDWTAAGWNAGETDAVSQVAGEGSGFDVQRTWTTVGDAKVRQEHADADGQTVGLHENFVVGGEELAFPADPSGSPAMTYSCRCSISYSVGGAAVDEGAVPDDEEGAKAHPNRLTRKQRRDAFRRFMDDVL